MILFIGEIKVQFNLLIYLLDLFDLVGGVLSGTRTNTLDVYLKCTFRTGVLASTAVVTYIMNAR